MTSSSTTAATASRALDELPATITIEEAGELLGISRRSAYRAAAAGELPTLRLGRRLLVPTPRLLALLGLPDGRADAPPLRPAGPRSGDAHATSRHTDR
ncbi:MAG: helix-turn-helix domain-containing protein [Egibacteraceae bacterium]